MTILTDFIKKPLAQITLALIAGLIVGLFIAWVAWPVEIIDTDFSSLRQDLRAEYLRMTIDSFEVNHDLNMAAQRYAALGPSAFQTFQEVKANPGRVNPQKISELEMAFTQAGLLSPSAPQAAGSGNGLVTVGLIFGGLLAVALIAGAGYYLFRGYRRADAPFSAAAQAAEINRSIEKTDYSATAAAPPVAQYVTTYVLGDDLFDDSFSIDSPAGEFLGECGVGISETIGVGDPKKVTAFEVWMFDKNDIQTVTKVLMSAHAFNDPTLRGKLESKGELAQVEPRSQVVLETQTLQMVVTVMDAQYGQGALPDQSYFERITLELAIWPK